MTKIKDLSDKIVPSIIGTFENQSHVLKFVEYVKHNEPWLTKFDELIISANGDKPWCEQVISELAPYFKTKITLLYTEPNLGHTFGIFDLDRKIFEYCANKDYEYVFKLSGDVLADYTIMHVDIDETCDFFYINNIGYTAVGLYGTEQNLINAVMDKTYFYPQTNYYIMRNKVKVWHPSSTETQSLKQQYEDKKKNDPTITPWAAIEGCDCEGMLKRTVEANNFKTQHLLNQEDTEAIVDIISKYEIYDGSHKNMLYQNVGGLCHYHIMNGMAIPVVKSEELEELVNE